MLVFEHEDDAMRVLAKRIGMEGACGRRDTLYICAVLHEGVAGAHTPQGEPIPRSMRRLHPCRPSPIITYRAKAIACPPKRSESRNSGCDTGGGGGNRTRVRKHSAFGSTCLATSTDFFRSATRRAGMLTGKPLSFNGVGRDYLHHELVSCRPLEPDAQARAGQGLALLRRPERSCRRWQLYCLQLDLRGVLRLDMHLGFCYPRRNQVAPLFCSGESTPDFRARHPERLIHRSRWRCQSRSRSLARLSCWRLPRAVPISALARPRCQ